MIKILSVRKYDKIKTRHTVELSESKENENGCFSEEIM